MITFVYRTMTASNSVMLGSHLLTNALQTRSLAVQNVKTSCTTIDDALLGGFTYGEICTIAGATGTGKTLVFLVPRHPG